MNVIDKDITVLQFIRDSAKPDMRKTFRTDEEIVEVENIERLSISQDKDGTIRKIHELGRISGIIRGQHECTDECTRT